MDLAFAIDELYSAGWWPEPGVSCLQSDDGRWYPDDAVIASEFEQASWRSTMSVARGDTIRVTWVGQGGIRGAAIASDQVSASILALAALVRSTRSEAALTG